MSAPSFSSFPPSFSSFPDFNPGLTKRESSTVDDGREAKKRKVKKEKDDASRKERKRKHERSAEGASHSKRRSSERGYGGVVDELLKAEEDSRRRNEEGLDLKRPTSPPLYFTDRKGDPLNVTYGGLHAGSVPRYHLVAWGKSVLGLDPVWRVVHRGRKGVEVAVGGRRKMHALTDSSSRHLLHAAPTRRLLASSEDKYKYQEVEGFLRVSSRHDRKNDQSYRDITAPKHDVDSDGSASSEEDEAESSEDESDTTPMTSLQATLKSLEERLSAEPSSISTWLSLLSHTLSTIPILSKNAPKARSEITLSVLSRALTAHPHNSSSKSLRLRYLKAGEEVWDASKLRAEWEDALKVGGIEIWMEWLDWRIRQGDKGMEGIIEDATRVLDSNSDDEIGKLRVLWRVAVAFRDAGYVERAHALFQAQAELTYKAPSMLYKEQFEHQLDTLEEFWESEVPRIGEAGAKGWAHWLERDRPTASTSARKVVEPTTTETDPFRRWATLESLSDRTNHLPTRSFDESADADPYATILFSDIRPLLISLRTPHAKHTLRMMWLAFLGLHVPGFLNTLSSTPGDNTDDRWAYTHLVSPAYLASILPADKVKAATRITADAQAGVLIGREREYVSAFGPIKNWGRGVLGPLEGATDERWTMWGPEDVADVDQGVVRQVFAQCRSEDNVEWEVLALAFEAACSLKEASRLSKTLLASAQESLSHWAAHARLERLRGRLDAARKVYQTVLTASRSHSPSGTQLWWDWAEMEWLAGRSDAAAEVIMLSTGTRGTGGVAFLRAKRHLQEALAQTPAARWEDREVWIKLLALLELLTASAQSALAVLDVHLGVLELGKPAHESLTVASLSLLYRHGTLLRNPLPPALLRERAEQAIEMCPSNTVILGIFLEAQKGQGIWGRVRAMLDDNTTDSGMREKDLVRRVAEVWVAGWEKGKWEAEQERTRGGLSAAVESERTRGSAVLWRMYVEFEIKAGQLERAKKLLFRAVGECPLVKELYLLAFGPLRSAFSALELNEWAETMAERGIRMRKGLDETVEGWKEDRDVRMHEANEEDGEEEIEARARELRRLMPY